MLIPMLIESQQPLCSRLQSSVQIASASVNFLPASAFDVFDFDIDTFQKPPAMLFHSRIDI